MQGGLDILFYNHTTSRHYRELAITNSEKITQDKAYKERLADWRQKHFSEMKTNLEIAKKIRDDDEAKPKDRIDAIKTISRMLGTLAPEKIEKKDDKPKKDTPFTEAEEQAIEERIAKTLEKSWTEPKENI